MNGNGSVTETGRPMPATDPRVIPTEDIGDTVYQIVVLRADQLAILNDILARLERIEAALAG